MDFKKNVLSEQLMLRGKVFSRLGWGMVASLIVLTGLLLNSSLKGPVVQSLFQGVYSVSNGSVLRHSSPTSSSSSASGSKGNAAGVVQLQRSPGVAQGGVVNVSVAGEKQDFMERNGGGMVLEDAHLRNFSEGVKNGSFEVEEGGGIQQMGNGSNGGLDSIITDEEILSELGNSTEVVDNGSLIGVKNKNANEAIEGKSEENPSKEVGNLANNGGVGGFPGAKEKTTEMNNQGNAVEENQPPNSDGGTQVGNFTEVSYEDCDFFDGKWVRDDSAPYYPPGSCPYVDRDFQCQRNGRPDDGYIKWKWQPNGCDIARLNATDFLERLRGKRLVFVGDSLNRNMWESLVCILRHSVADKNRVYEISGRSDFKKMGFYAFRFEDYNCSVDFVGAPFLVKESNFQRGNETIETLRLDLIDPSTSMYQDAEVMVFNTGHWWTHEKTSKGEDYYQEGDFVYPRLKVLKAFQKALHTWARWVDENVDSTRTQVFFRGYSVAHFWRGQWNSGGQCDKETEPITSETHLAKYPSKMRALENVIRKARTPIMYLNISRLTDYRKDAHPSIYRRQYKTPEEWIAAERSQDCSHWCLPGVPDTWNELLYASLLKAGKGVWASRSAGNAAGAVQLQSFASIMHGNGEVNVSVDGEKQDFKEGDGDGVVSENEHVGNFSEEVKNGNFGGQEGGGVQQMRNESHGGLDSIITDAEILDELRNLTEVVDNGSLISEKNKNANEAIEGNSEENPGKEERNLPNNGSVAGFLGAAEEKAVEVNDQGNADEEYKPPNSKGDRQVGEVKVSYEDCDFFDGRWVRDDSEPYYPPGSCPYVDRDFDCQHNGRPDDGYIKWKWQPNGCDVPRLNATDFLERLRGKRLVFVGDSLNRNMWESLLCILRHSVTNKNRVYEISGRSDFKKKGFYAFRFEDYNCSVDFIGAPFLVRESTFQRRNAIIETLRLDLMDASTSMYQDAEVMVFNTGHWWTHEKTSKGEDYYQERDYVYPRLKVLKAFQKALRTWARWVDRNVNSTRTQVFYRGYSVTHFWGGQWNSGGQCHKETEPITNKTHLTKYPSKMRALENVIRKAKTPIMYLNISRLTDYRKDAHPSIYRRQYKTPEEWIAAERSQDCSHWCLPGVPDTWNELLYASLLKAGKGVWGNQA